MLKCSAPAHLHVLDTLSAGMGESIPGADNDMSDALFELKLYLERMQSLTGLCIYNAPGESVNTRVAIFDVHLSSAEERCLLML